MGRRVAGVAVVRRRKAHRADTVRVRAQRLAVALTGAYPTSRAAWLAVVAHAYRNGYSAGRARALYRRARKGRR